MKIDSKTRNLIYKLRNEKGLKLEEIAEKLRKRGINISLSAIDYHYHKALKNQEIYGNTDGNKPKRIDDEKIFELRELGLSYESIADFFESQGIKIHFTSIQKRCKKIYEKKGLEVPITKYSFRVLSKIDELRKRKFTYLEIAKEISKSGKRVSEQDVEKIIKKVLSKKYKKHEDVDKKNNGYDRKDLPLQTIYDLREIGLSYRKIAEHLTEFGIPVSRNTVRERCKEIYSSKKEESKLKRGTSKLDKGKEVTLEELDNLATELLEKKAKTGELLQEYQKLENSKNVKIYESMR